MKTPVREDLLKNADLSEKTHRHGGKEVLKARLAGRMLACLANEMAAPPQMIHGQDVHD
jgi:hypothetical protein